MADLPRRHAEPEARANVRLRIVPGSVYRVSGCGPVREADTLLYEAEQTCLRLTGCME
ncbi:hypothetical protein ACIRPX_35645 [Streptomyces sp. NPDC101225]|uniref:hypothetical protein n=1 Tax=Streptomyces sp. NPDC101225 TaxID=3366135 RepID=UPI0037F8B4E9